MKTTIIISEVLLWVFIAGIIVSGCLEMESLTKVFVVLGVLDLIVWEWVGNILDHHENKRY